MTIEWNNEWEKVRIKECVLACQIKGQRAKKMDEKNWDKEIKESKMSGALVVLGWKFFFIFIFWFAATFFRR